MNKYELIYIIDTTVEEAARKELIEKFNGIIAANGGEVVKVEEWGKRRLAYAIDYKTEGYYACMSLSTALPSCPRSSPVISASTRTSSVLRSSSCLRRRAA